MAKVFDIAAPKEDKSTKASASNDPKGHKLIAEAPKDEEASLENVPVTVTTAPEAPVSRRGTTILPASDEPKDAEAPAADTTKATKPEEQAEPVSPTKTSDEQVADEQPVNSDEKEVVASESTKEPTEPPANTEVKTEPSTPEPNDKDITLSEPVAVSDGLPDDSQKATMAAADVMQEPKIYDTKAYFVPIGKSVHGHSGRGALWFGLFVALAVVGGVVYYALYML